MHSMVDGRLAAAVAATPASRLLPQRSQARAELLIGEAEVLDALELGGDSWLAIVEFGDRRIVCPGTIKGNEFNRQPEVASRLRAGDFGAFRVELPGGALGARTVKAIDVDQTNDSVICDGVVIKWQLDAAPSPAARALRAVADASVTPPVRALVEWTDSSGQVCTLATAAEFLEGAEDGWTWAVDVVRAHARGEVVDAIGPFAQLGEMTARMHVALAGLGVEKLDAAACSALADSASAALDEAVSVTGGDEGRRLRGRSTFLHQRIAGLRAISTTPVMAIHGDLHVGQVLRSPDGALSIIDFDGNPLLTPAERMLPAPPARDVAGMLASIDHVARVVNFRTDRLDPRPALVWIAHAQEAFLASYQQTLNAAGRRELLDDRLLAPFLIEQECREYIYAAKHLPHWVYVPDAVISEYPVDGVDSSESDAN
ncbi:MAG: hypothetical protein RJB01_594 [Actinomycetota bacterium]